MYLQLNQLCIYTIDFELNEILFYSFRKRKFCFIHSGKGNSVKVYLQSKFNSEKIFLCARFFFFYVSFFFFQVSYYAKYRDTPRQYFSHILESNFPTTFLNQTLPPHFGIKFSHHILESNFPTIFLNLTLSPHFGTKFSHHILE